MKSDLRILIAAEDAVFAGSMKYASTLQQLKFQKSIDVNQPTGVVGINTIIPCEWDCFGGPDLVASI